MHSLGFYIIHCIWVPKQEMEENKPEVLAMYKNTLVNTSKTCAITKTIITLVVQQHAYYNTELPQSTRKH